MTSRNFILPANWITSHKVLSGPVAQFVKAMNLAGHDLVMTIAEASKTRDQEGKYHSMIGDLSEQIGGDLGDKEDAKRILISAFRIDTLQELAQEWAEFGDMRMGRGLRGEVVLLGVQSRKFKRKLASAFIEWLYQFGAEGGYFFTEWVEDAGGHRHKITWQMAAARAQEVQA